MHFGCTPYHINPLHFNETLTVYLTYQVKRFLTIDGYGYRLQNKEAGENIQE